MYDHFSQETLHLLPNGNSLIMCIKELIHIIAPKLMNVNQHTLMATPPEWIHVHTKKVI